MTLIMGETLKEHNEKLEEVFAQIRKYNSKIEPDKCEFLKTELQYVGHVITTQGVQPDPKKVSAVQNFPKPQQPKGIKAFLGLAGYYRKFIPNFSKISKPLTELLKKDIKWQWSDEEEESFQTLKNKLVTAPGLQYPDFSNEFIVMTDASGYALGAILSQGKLGKD